MNPSSIKRILDTLKKKKGEEYLIKEGKKLTPLFSDMKSAKNTKKIVFIDGGNADILVTAGYAVQLIRVAGIVFKGKKRIETVKKEWIVLVKKIMKEKKAYFSVEEINEETNESINFELECKEMCYDDVFGLIRRIKELKLGLELIERVDFVVLDGSLEFKHPLEEKYVKKLMSTKKAFGLCKTTGVYTNHGRTANEYLLEQKKDIWLCDAGENLHFIHLHKKSDYVFRLDASDEKLSELFYLLIENSKDPVFLGYPYGLIYADKIARVSDEECKALQMELIFKAGDKADQLKKAMKSKDAHSILDNIK